MGDIADVPYFSDRVEVILTCVKCCMFKNPTFRSCGHVYCATCVTAGNDGDCQECHPDMEHTNNAGNGGVSTKHFDQMFTLYDYMRDISISEYDDCRQCGKRNRISELWVCPSCSVAVTCSACLIGKCAHGDTGNPPRSVETILSETKAHNDRWRPLFKEQIDTLSPQINHLSSQLDLVAGRVAAIADVPEFIGVTLEQFRREMHTVKTEVESVKGKASDLEALIKNNRAQLRRFPTNMVMDLTGEIDRQCGKIRLTMGCLAGSFEHWLQYSRGFGNAQLEAACRLDDEGGGQQAQA